MNIWERERGWERESGATNERKLLRRIDSLEGGSKEGGMKVPGEVRCARAVSRLWRASGEAGGHVSRRSAVEWSSLCVVRADPDSDGWMGGRQRRKECRGG